MHDIFYRKSNEPLVIKLGLANYIYDYAKNAKDADIAALEDAIIKTKNVYYMEQFAKNVKGADTKKIEDAINKIFPKKEIPVVKPVEKSKEELKDEETKAELKKENDKKVNEFQEKLIESANYDLIYSFAKNVKGADIEKIKDILNKSGNTYDFSFVHTDDISFVEGLKKFQNDLIKSTNAKLMYDFALSFERIADIDLLRETIDKLGDKMTSMLFNSTFPDPSEME